MVSNSNSRLPSAPWLGELLSLRVPGLVILMASIQLLLPPSLTLGPVWLIPVIELAGIPLWLVSRKHESESGRVWAVFALSYLSLLVAASVLNAALALATLFTKTTDPAGYLLFGGFGVLAVNVLSFGLVYWWIDGGGPKVRESGSVTTWDFQFPQQGSPVTGGDAWAPQLFDYIYTAYTNIIAFSPTDTMPLSHRAKFLFIIQSAVSLVTILVTVSRAINLIPD